MLGSWNVENGIKAFFFRTLIEKHLGIGDNQLLEISKKRKKLAICGQS